MSKRVVFNHVEVICEGYDYPEDDYILLGSCGLEFTLDYSDPHDYHDNSYFHHMDDHEKQLHRDKVGASTKPNLSPNKLTYGYAIFIDHLVEFVTTHVFIVAALILLATLSLVLVKLLSTNTSSPNKKAKPMRGSSYGHFTTAVLSTKKAC